MASLKELRLPHENWELTGWIISFFYKKHQQNNTSQSNFASACKYLSTYQHDIYCEASNFESAYVHIIHPDVWRNSTAPFVFTTAEVEQMLHITYQLIIGPINWSSQPTNQPTSYEMSVSLLNKFCSIWATSCLFVRNNPRISPSENHTQPRIATNSWHTHSKHFQTIWDQNPAMERIDRLRKLSSNKKHQTSSNFQKLMTHSTSYSLLMEKKCLKHGKNACEPCS